MSLKAYYCLIFLLFFTVNSAVTETQICPSLEDLGLDFDLKPTKSACGSIYYKLGGSPLADIASSACSYVTHYGTRYGYQIQIPKPHEISLVAAF